eukprot:8229517-Alexandrium_andersonii.AAC.1
MGAGGGQWLSLQHSAANGQQATPMNHQGHSAKPDKVPGVFLWVMFSLQGVVQLVLPLWIVIALHGRL